MTQAVEGEKKHGCCFYGCITMVILVVLVVVGIWVAVNQGIKWLVREYTAEEAVALPVVEYAPEVVSEIDQRLQVFNAAIADNKPADPLVLSADDINALIAGRDDMKELKGRLHVTIEDNQLKGRISVPLELLAPNYKKAKGRFVNGSVVLDASTQGGVLVLRVTDAELRGKHLPAAAMEELKKQNLLEKFYEDVEKMKSIQRIKSIEMRDGKLVVEAATGSSQ